MKLFGGDDFELTVTGTREISEHYLALSFAGGGLLKATELHPTMWVRCWFAKDGALHQRGYTLVDPDAAADTFDIEFALHDGTAADWARAARPGDTIAVTVMGSKFAFPDPAPTGLLLAGDTASLPAINSILDAAGAAGLPAPATIWFEYQHDSDRDLPMRTRDGDTVHYVPRERDGARLVDEVRSAAFAAPGQFGWVALDDGSTRAIAGIFKNDFGLGRKRVKSMAYWKVGKPFA